MTINPRTLLRMPLEEVLRIAHYWGVWVDSDLDYASDHTWKRRLVRKLWWEGYNNPDMKSDFGQWRKI